LFYPNWSFVSRLVTVEKFLRKAVPLIHGATHIVRDLIDFIRPHLLKCETICCGEGPTPDVPIHNEQLVNCVLEKFLSPAISNYASYISEMEKPKLLLLLLLLLLFDFYSAFYNRVRSNDADKLRSRCE
jgi:hypothetical protein